MLKEEKGPNKGSVVFLITLLVVFIGLTIAAFLWINKSPKTLFENQINNIFKLANSNIEEFNKMDSYKQTIKINKLNVSTVYNTKELPFDVNKILKVINDLSLEVISETDLKNKIINEDLKLSYNGENQLDANIYINATQNLYLTENSLYQKMLKININDYLNQIFGPNIDIFEYFVKSNEKNKTLETVLNEVQKAIIASLKTEYFKRSNESLSINGTTVKVVKNTLTIDKNNAQEIALNIIEKLDNESFKTAWKELSNQTLNLNEIKEKIQETNYEEMAGTFIYSIYTKGILNSVVREELFVTSNKVSTDFINVGVEKIKSDEYNIDFKTRTGGAEQTATISIVQKGNNNKINLDIPNIGNLTLDYDYKLEKNVSVKKKDISDAQEIEKLNNADAMNIYTNLMNKKFFVDLVGIFGAL